MHVGTAGALELPRGARAGARNAGYRGERDGTGPARCPGVRRAADPPGAAAQVPLIRHLGLAPYEGTWRAMQRFTDERDASTRDEIWCLEHPPVFTLGLNASRAHLLAPGDIPVVQIDRGGQVTYHGPGQLVIYPLIDLRRHRSASEARGRARECGDRVCRRAGSEGARIARRSGRVRRRRQARERRPRIRRGSSYHGMALNVSADLEPFRRINVCGYPGLRATRLCDLCAVREPAAAAAGLVPHLLREMGF